MADIPDILKGPGMDVVSGLALGAFMGNPLLGLALAPQVNRMRRGAEKSMALTDAQTDAAELANENTRLDMAAIESLPLMNASRNPITGEPVAQDVGADPYLSEAQKLKLAARLPQNVGSQVMGTGRMNPRQLMSMAAEMGIDLTDDQILNMIGANQQTGFDELRAAIMAADLRTKELAAADKADSIRRAKATANIGVRNSVRGTQKALDNLELLTRRASSLRPGTGFSEWARTLEGAKSGVMNFFGADTGEADALLTAYDELKKGLALATVDTAGSFDDLGTLTDQKFRILLQASPSMDITPTAMKGLLLDNLESRLDAAKIGDIGFDEEPAREYLKEMRESDAFVRPPGAGAAAVDSVGRFAEEAANAGMDLVSYVASGAADARDVLEEQIAMIRQKTPDVTEEELAEMAEWFLGKVEAAQTQGSTMMDEAGGMLDRAVQVLGGGNDETEFNTQADRRNRR